MNFVIGEMFHPYAEHSLSQKRNRSPPAYIIHQSQGGLVLAPPCPMYGAVESSSLEGESDA